jgi:hypothetical protein
LGHDDHRLRQPRPRGIPREEHGEVALGFAFFSKFIMPLAIGHHPLVTWTMFIIAGCLIASGIAIGLARRSYGDGR